jgi:ABC-type Na+ efflux pump permease subunit
MRHPSWFIAVHDLRHMLGRRETLLWTFLMPIVFFYFIGTVTGARGGGGPLPDTVAVRVGPEAGFLADTLIRRLEEQEFIVVRPEAAPSSTPATAPTARPRPFESYARRLEIPGGFTASALAGERPKLVLTRTVEGMTAVYTDFRIQRAMYTLLADVLAVRAEGGAQPVTAEDVERIHHAPRPLTVETAAAGRRQRIPTGFEQAVPGTMVMFAMLVLLTGGTTVLVVERRLGLLRRLASAPISRRSVVLGKWTSKLALALVQMGFALLTGRLLFGVSWGPHWPMVFVVLLFYAAFLACLGLLLGSLARTEGQAVALGVLASNVAGALGGCWWPIEVTPPYMQKLALALPTGWAMDALHRLVSFEMGPASVLPHLAVFAGATLVTGALAVRVFRYD